MTPKTQTLAFTALLAALTAVLAQIAIPLPFTPVPLTLGTLGGYLAAGLLTWQAAAMSQLVYVLIGAVGIPVFAGFTGGFGILMGPTGGYLIGYIVLALAAGFIISKASGKFYWFVIAMIAGTFFCYLFGTIWFMAITKNGMAASISACVIPFLPGDAIKIVLASLLSCKLRPILKRKIV
ncbi:MAG: biotin transporter BioY [Christensenellales bacterium]